MRVIVGLFTEFTARSSGAGEAAATRSRIAIPGATHRHRQSPRFNRILQLHLGNTYTWIPPEKPSGTARPT